LVREISKERRKEIKADRLRRAFLRCPDFQSYYVRLFPDSVTLPAFLRSLEILTRASFLPFA
jgi:hypothetical protein